MKNCLRSSIPAHVVLLCLTVLAWGITVDANQSPIGFLDGANCNGFGGWTCDADNYSKPLTVAFYATNQSGVIYVGSTTANAPRDTAVGNMCGGNVFHGFVYVLPDSLKDGQSHGIYAYAINTPNGTNPPLSNNGKVIQCACTPNAVSGCRVCKADGSEWVDNNSRCDSNQSCLNGACIAGRILSLEASATVATYNFKKNLFLFSMPTELNILGFSGSVSLTDTSNYFAEELVTLGFYPNKSGECPVSDSGTSYDTYEEIAAKYPGGPMFQFILKTTKPGTVGVPTEFTLPVKKHVRGCLFLILDGSEMVHASTVRFNSDMVLRYDTDAAPANSDQFAISSPFGFEYCYGQNWGCMLASVKTSEKDAFAFAQSITSYSDLWQIFGNPSASAFTGGSGFANAPSGPWTADFDYYVYPTCSNLSQGSNGPDDYYSKIPSGAVKIAGVQFNGTGSEALQQPVVYQFSPMLLKPGNCFVGLTRFVSSSGGGDVESQVKALVQNVQGSALGRVFADVNGNDRYDSGENYIQDSSASCANGTKMSGVKIKFTGPIDGEAVINNCNPDPYYSINLPEGTYQISLQLPSGWETTNKPETIAVEAGKSEALVLGIRQSIKGFLDAAACTSFTGWACDPYNYSNPLAVHFYADVQAGSGGISIGSTIGNRTREQAVGDLCGGNSNHGFNYPAPPSLKDGKNHTIYAYAINIPSGNNSLLGNKTMFCLVASTTTTTNSPTSILSSTSTTTSASPTTSTSFITTTSMTTSTSTTISQCVMPGNYAPCGEISLSEVVGGINKWADGSMGLGGVVELINSWADPVRYPPN